MSLVTTDDLRDYMSGIGLDADQANAAQMILDGLQRDLERHIQRPFERKERTETCWPDELGRVWPKATPVVSVSVPDGIILSPSGAIVAGSYAAYTIGGFLDYGLPVEVTYVGGLIDMTLEEGDPGFDEQFDLWADVRIAILRAAAREMEPRHDDTLSVSELSARPPRTPPIRSRSGSMTTAGWADSELAQFDRLRRRTVA
jgi:hypothetical protein